MSTCALSFSVAATGENLMLTVCLDHDVIYSGIPTVDTQEIRYEFDDSTESEHVLTFEMSGKLPEDTTLDADGNIIDDAVLTISSITFDDIQLGHMVTEVSTYHHDTNGTTAPVTDSFYGIMGCNGRVELRFSTPIYLWLLENM
jgi:hypothetical protein